MYVTFEQAKWLNSKGFDKSCKMVWDNWGHLEEWEDENPHKNSTKNGSVYYSAPDQHQVVEWLFDQHGIWISVDKQNYKRFKWRVSNINLRNDAISDLIEKSGFNCDTSQQAYSAAFDYIKDNNLI